MKKAKAAAGANYVGVAGASASRQCLYPGLIDEIHLHVVPVLLGDGIRLFDQLNDHLVESRS
ncbi:dihydrofolate reductase family protein [Alteribacillus bidgolensis]|uniref:dihydrofolate reductase family protein n=1 Tax=Alteribacillus bidgolensis TaxID=930129 RepID=UPI00349E634A